MSRMSNLGHGVGTAPMLAFWNESRGREPSLGDTHIRDAPRNQQSIWIDLQWVETVLMICCWFPNQLRKSLVVPCAAPPLSERNDNRCMVVRLVVA